MYIALKVTHRFYSCNVTVGALYGSMMHKPENKMLLTCAVAGRPARGRPGPPALHIMQLALLSWLGYGLRF